MLDIGLRNSLPFTELVILLYVGWNAGFSARS
jgi:hypothetical protein